MRICIVVLAVAFVSPSIVNAQSDEREVSLALEINRVQYALTAAENQILNTNWLEPSEDQRKELKDLLVARTAINDAMSKAGDLPLEERIEALASIQTSLHVVEGKLRTEILLPHQLIPFDQHEFENLLFMHGGDYVKVVGTYYGKQFELTDEQKEKLKDVKQATSQKIHELEVKFQADKVDVQKGARKELGEIFTQEQIKFIEKVSGEKLVPEDMPNKKKTQVQ